MDTEELKVRTPISARTHTTYLLVFQSPGFPQLLGCGCTAWFLGGGWSRVETWSEEAFFSTMTMLVSSPVTQQAVEVMCFVPKRCNDMMTLGRLRGFEVWG